MSNFHKGFSTTIGILTAITVFPILAYGVAFFLVPQFFDKPLPFLQPANQAAPQKPELPGQNLPPAQKAAADEWDRKAERDRQEAAKKRREQLNREIAEQREKIGLPPSNAEQIPQAAPQHEIDIDGPEAILQPAPDLKTKGKRPRKLPPETPKLPLPELQKMEQEKIEAAAAARLKTAKGLLKEGKAEQARKWLKRIVDEDGDTEAAVEARELLKSP